MSISEFDIIQRYFKSKLIHTNIHRLGIGDDAAVLEIPQGLQLVTSVDSLNEGIHFPEQASAFNVGYKALAVSVSDIAAMGAEPLSVLLSLSLPCADLGWLQEFSAGFFALATKVHIDLIGGDICRGPLSVTTVVNGLVPQGQAILRSHAKLGDRIYVTGNLGDAGLALHLLRVEADVIDDLLLQRLHRPEPRVAAGLALRTIAHSAMDISDGLLTDLTKLCVASDVGAVVYAHRLPLSAVLQKQCTLKEAWQYALCSGDDYELIFTIPPDQEQRLLLLPREVTLTYIGEIKTGSGVEILDEQGHVFPVQQRGYEHFSEDNESE
ncbi:MAG: thiamine-phosphate kinase [Coxiella sp. RIFCSPHIGHO2_12_FULL_44_14]|nr:MAG: thiamine-phosphate kinase [Coxiella sp. RIFCSPHIGHO2_12_FULL_44_14]